MWKGRKKKESKDGIYNAVIHELPSNNKSVGEYKYLHH